MLDEIKDVLSGKWFWQVVCAVCGVAIVLVGLLWLGEFLGHRSTQKQLVAAGKKLDAANTELGACRAESLQLSSDVTYQTAKVQDWKAEAIAAEKEADKRVAAAQRQADGYRSRAASLLAAETSDPDRCAAASRLYMETIGSQP